MEKTNVGQERSIFDDGSYNETDSYHLTRTSQKPKGREITPESSNI